MLRVHYKSSPVSLDFGANKTPIKVIKQGAFGETFFRDTCSSVNGKCYRKSWVEFNELKNVDCKYNCSDYYDVAEINIVLDAEHCYDFGKVMDRLIL